MSSSGEGDDEFALRIAETDVSLSWEHQGLSLGVEAWADFDLFGNDVGGRETLGKGRFPREGDGLSATVEELLDRALHLNV